MFCRKRNDGIAKLVENSNKDDFGWWLSNENKLNSSTTNQDKDCLSLGSSESMLSCIDSEDDDSYSLAQEFRQERNNNCERIELASLIHEDLDVNLIEQDAIGKESEVTPFSAKEAENYFDESKSKSRGFQAVCYTPERLIKSQEYRILTPSPRYLSISQARIMPENENQRKALRCRRRLNYLIDSKQVGLVRSNSAEVAVPTIVLHHWNAYRRSYDSDENGKLEITQNGKDMKKSSNVNIPGLLSERSSEEGLSISWEDWKKIDTRSSSLEDTSGIQSNDWSSDTHSDTQNTPLCLFDELASTNYKFDSSQERGTRTNEVVSILKALDTDPEKAMVLLEEDRFCNSTSSHDQLTRLALAIETDTKVPEVVEHSENIVHRLQMKVEKLQASSKDIYKDICNLRTSFQCDERKVTDISSSTNKLRQDIHEMRYLDDLLSLLRGEIERISKRNWPFVIGRTEHDSEEMNLIV
ncbi:uncharacterized protein LOC128891140 [Hylaeus anthracinus]|uniref:uncharacterized protein LOC128891140 n=1 Tax=Hylaeus anthracinus TaxID=313031 RepID=UPI0023BA078C|nr:uncharacterized protein LOC128891140 [Hylaeus anthracinus]XP_054006353.1 uncharacterized protein LOC128891140 [Hylaeus anthracinus]XP_054006354.1 uncharacterized protein LOC128891140 [Hylaeus anthracinus]XP_054006355.1 uncharacterized protein LOC128891140 [Hylaeus anthracinus]XP_054006356.1 uncharacterized protein LOC128891140 [Hylaeus anthracinus]